MVSDFIGAAFPWILMGLFVAISCSLMSNLQIPACRDEKSIY